MIVLMHHLFKIIYFLFMIKNTEIHKIVKSGYFDKTLYFFKCKLHKSLQHKYIYCGKNCTAESVLV